MSPSLSIISTNVTINTAGDGFTSNADGDDKMDINSIRDQTHDTIQNACNADHPILVESPPGSGKSTSIYKLAVNSDTPPITYLAGRQDLYEQMQTWCEKHSGVNYETIPSPHRSCKLFQDNDGGSKQEAELLYNKGYSIYEIHSLLDEKESCEYLTTIEKISNNTEKIDVLIGNHKHSYRETYITNRLVIIDEFNPGPFLYQFPAGERDNGIDSPHELIPAFLEGLHQEDTGFPREFEDLTDLLTYREDDQKRDKALDWFIRNGVSRNAATDLDFITPSTYVHDRDHLLAPLLTFSLLCMERLGRGIEVAPPLNEGSRREAWFESDLSDNYRCVRDRNTGEMYVFRPPDLTSAAQVIGLDGLPTVELWDLLFAPETGFKVERIVHRDSLSEYIRSALGIELVQLAQGMNFYSGGRISDADKQRLEFVDRSTDGGFALIAPKKAIEAYEQRGWLDNYVLKEDEARNEFRARNYSQIRSSNEFSEEPIGVVSGAPSPGDDVIRYWAGLCGYNADPEGEGVDKSFGEFGDRIYYHFVHHQVVQAILRFGRSESSNPIVYVNTKALPEWLETGVKTASSHLESGNKYDRVIEYLIRVKRQTEYPVVERRIRDISEECGVSTEYVRQIVGELSEEELVSIRPNAGKGGSDLYQWSGDDQLQYITNGQYRLLLTGNVHIINVES